MIVEHLKMRYNKTQIYTYIGDILLAVNPFTPLTIYSDEVKEHFISDIIKLEQKIIKLCWKKKSIYLKKSA